MVKLSLFIYPQIGTIDASAQKKQTQGEMIPLESISHYVSDSDFGRTNTRISKIRWCSTRVTVTSSVS